MYKKREAFHDGERFSFFSCHTYAKKNRWTFYSSNLHELLSCHMQCHIL